MTIEEVCLQIELPEEVREMVLAFSDAFDFESVRAQIQDMKSDDEKKNDAAIGQLNEILGDDPKKMKMLACMLKCAAEAHDWYVEKEICDEIYAATMKCFTRFLGECRRRTGEYAFDREWWTVRQVACRLFRIGELEYERKQCGKAGGGMIVSLHIPSDADLSDAACDDSIQKAKTFFGRYFPEQEKMEYRCESWLLSPDLKEMLPPESRIMKFQKRFRMVGEAEPGLGVLEWVYHTREHDLDNLPEETSLQRKMKPYLVEHGGIREGIGILREKETE